MLTLLQIDNFYLCESNEFRSFIIQLSYITTQDIIVAKYGICPSAKSYYENSAIIVKKNYNFTEAAPSQIKHLMNCAKKGRYTSAPRNNNIVDNYNVF